MATRKTPQEVAKESLATANRVHEAAKTRLTKAKAAFEKATIDEKFAARRVRAARLLTLEEELDAIEPEPTPAAPAEDDVL